MQDMEFTIEKGKLFMLQTRNGKRTAQAALKIAIDMVKEGLITEQQAVLMVEPKSLDALLHKGFDQKHSKQLLLLLKVYQHLQVLLVDKLSLLPIVQRN